MITDQEKLEVIEHFIEQWRPGRSSGIEGERATYLTLKEIASDIRGRRRHKMSEAAKKIQRAITNAHERKTRAGFEPGNLREIAELVIGLWPAILYALERQEEEGK